MDLPKPWSEEKLRRYDAAWSRVFAGISPELIPRFPSPPEEERLRLQTAQARTGLILRRLARFLPRHRAALLTLAAEFEAHAGRCAAALPPGRLTPGARLKQLKAELLRRESAFSRIGDARGAALCRKAAEALGRME